MKLATPLCLCSIYAKNSNQSWSQPLVKTNICILSARRLASYHRMVLGHQQALCWPQNQTYFLPSLTDLHKLTFGHQVVSLKCSMEYRLNCTIFEFIHSDSIVLTYVYIVWHVYLVWCGYYRGVNVIDQCAIETLSFPSVKWTSNKLWRPVTTVVVISMYPGYTKVCSLSFYCYECTRNYK